MPLPSAPLNNLPVDEWSLALTGPVAEAFVTGDEGFYYVWSNTGKPAAGSIVGHFVERKENEVIAVPAGMTIWVRPAESPLNLTITIEPEV